MANPVGAQPPYPKVAAAPAPGASVPSGAIKLPSNPKLPKLPSLPPGGAPGASPFKLPPLNSPKGALKSPPSSGAGTPPLGAPPKANFVAAPKKTLLRVERTNSIGSSGSGSGDASPRLPSPRDAALPPPLPAALPQTAAPKTHLPTLPVGALPAPLPRTAMLPIAIEPLKLPVSSPHEEEDGEDDSGSALGAGLSATKKPSARRKGSTSVRAEGIKPVKKSKSSSSQDLQTTSALGPAWDSVYADFEKRLQKDAMAGDVSIAKAASTCPDLPRSVQAYNAAKGKTGANTPFYVEQTLGYYTDATKALAFASATYGEAFPLKELAIASTVASSSPDGATEPLSPSSTPSESPETARERSSSKNFGHAPSTSLSGIGLDKKSKSPQPLLLARSSAMTGAGTGSTGPGRQQRASSTASLLPPPAGIANPAGAPAFPYSPRGSLNMLGSWLNTDSAARMEERKRREIRATGAPQHVFQTLDAQTLISEPSESSISEVGPIKPHLAPQQLLVRCKALAWNFATNCEALQCTISVHDVAQRIKLTEDFHMDFVDEMEQNILTTMLPELLGTPTPESKARRALVPLSYRSGSIYMLVRIRAVLKADTEESFEPYVTQGKLKDQQRWIDNSAKSAKHLGKFRQPLAWGAVQIFNDASRLLLHDDTQIKLYRMRPALDDNTFYDTITSPEKLKLAKHMEGALSLSGFLYTPEKYHLQNLVDTNLTQYSKADGQLPPAMVASPGAARTVITDIVKEVHEFAQSFHQVYPNAAYLNNLYVYPTQLSLNASKIKAKSIAIRAYLMPSEGLPEKDGLVAIYGLSSTPNFHPSWTTTVDLGEKSPNFFDEIKISLPIQLTDSFHLYFQAYAVNPKVVNPKKKTDADAETLIGVAWVPLFKDNRFVANGTRTVAFQPVPEGNPPNIPSKGYLGSADGQEPSGDDKLTLTFATRLVSSVYTTDPHLATFYSGVMRSGDDYFKALDGLANAPEREILARFVPILNYLFSQLCTPKLSEALKVTEKYRKAAISRTMLAIVDIVAKVSALTAVNGKQSISEELLMYVSHHFDPGTELSDQSFQLIAVAWVKALQVATNELKAMGKAPNFGALSPVAKAAASSLQEHGWFYLNMIVRSLALKVIEKREIADDASRKTRYTEKFSKTICKMVVACHDLRRASLAGFDFFNRMLARFMGNLYRYMDRGFVSQLVSTHLAELGKESKVTTIFRFKFLQTLCEFEHYVALNHPTIQPVTDSTAGAMRVGFWRQHFLAGHYINEFQTLLLTGEEGRITRAKSIIMFRDLLWKHSLDPRYNSVEWQMRIATMYLPLVVLASDHMDMLIGTTSGLGVATAMTNTSAEWKDWSYVTLWILRYCNRDIVLKTWRKTMRVPQMAKFLTFLRFIHETFAKPLLLASSSADTPSPAAYALVDEVVLTIDDVLDHFLDGNETLLDGTSKAFAELSSLITALMRSPTTSLVTSATVGMVRFFCSGLRKPLFRDVTTNFACSDLCTELLTLCQQQHPQVMASATAVFYLMMKQNWEELGEFSRMRRHSTVALSNILKGSLATAKLDELNRSLEAMAAHTDPSLSKEFTDQVQQLIQRHRRVLRDCLRVEQFSLEFLDLKLESCYNIANEYQDCPELRVQWLMEMAKLHEKVEGHEEAAMCRVQAAWLVAQYLNLHPMSSHAQYHSIATPNSALLRVAPNLLMHEPPLGATPPVSAAWFTEESLLSMLYDACQGLAKAEQYESATDVLSFYVQFCMDVKKYQYVSQNGQLIQEWASKAEKSIRAQSRIPPNFYRVGFYGKGFGEDATKEYIYKAPPSIRLADFTETLVSRHAPQFAVEVLNNKPIADQKIDPAKNYVQIVNLEPYFETDVNKDITWLDRTRNVRRFYYETAYNPDGSRPSEDVSKMYKRRELITGKMAFPNFFRRVAIEKKESVILQPIDCALDLMVILTSKLKAALNCVPIVSKSLQIILQGAVLAQVNAGPAAIIATFLNSPEEYPTESIDKLKESIRAFVRACNFGLILNQKLIQDQPETAALQEAMMSAFQTLQAEASKHVDI